MDQKDKVGQDHGKGENSNHISNDTLSSLVARKRLLVAPLELSGIVPPPEQSKGKGVWSPEPLWVIFIFSSSFLFLIFFPNIPRINWTKSEEKRNFRGMWVLGLVSSWAPTVPVPPTPNTWRSPWLWHLEIYTAVFQSKSKNNHFGPVYYATTATRNEICIFKQTFAFKLR